MSTNGAVTKGREPIDKTWEIPESDGEQGSEVKTQRGRIQAQTAAAKASLKNTSRDIDGVYDFEASDEKPSPAQTPSRKARGPASASTRASATAESTTPTTARKVFKPQAQSPGSKRAGRSAVAKPKSQGNESKDDDDNTPAVSSSSEDELTPAPARSVNKLQGTAGTPRLKGILTPSKRLSERNTKSVAFDNTESKTDEIYFADLPSKTNKAKPVQSKSRPSHDQENHEPAEQRAEAADEEEEEEDDEDDEVCVICSKPDSKPPNQILFCDSCDMAVHQKCYGVARIPKGDWLCKDCSQQSSSGMGAGKRKTTTVPAQKVPAIPNFEQHLRALQRVLLDRLTGRRRIRLRDQDEAFEKTFQLVEQTVLAGEGNSMLVIGARGCGKTTVSSGVFEAFQTQAILMPENRWWTWCFLISAGSTRMSSMSYASTDLFIPMTSLP